uniref:C-type lectin domain-containing protein n=1 Tax=Plectus sambesii TaxID=2011161 RepID=A0A914VGX0_9BILA
MDVKLAALELAKEHLKDFTSFWIGLKAWSNKWYLDDESNATYFNFADPTQTNQNIIGINNELMGCVQSNGSGLWSILDCQAMLPFVCERNTADPNIQHTPFAPYQEQPCQNAGGACKVDNDCGTDSHQISHLCPEQPNNILCCIPNTSSLTPPPPLNSTVKTCADAGGICNHVEADQCRGGFVVFDLPKPCPDEPRPYGCCIENEHFA